MNVHSERKSTTFLDRLSDGLVPWRVSDFGDLAQHNSAEHYDKILHTS